MERRKYKSKGKIKELYEQAFLTNQMTGCTPLIKDPLFKVSFGKETIQEVKKIPF